MLSRAALLALLFVLLSGCVSGQSMRQVQAIDSSETSVKFLYTQQVEDRFVRGVIECDVDGDELTNCRDLNVEYR